MAYVYGISETNEEGKRQKGQDYCPWLGIEGETVQITAHILTCETNVNIIVEVLKSYHRQEKVGRT